MTLFHFIKDNARDIVKKQFRKYRRLIKGHTKKKSIHCINGWLNLIIKGCKIEKVSRDEICII